MFFGFIEFEFFEYFFGLFFEKWCWGVWYLMFVVEDGGVVCCDYVIGVWMLVFV